MKRKRRDGRRRRGKVGSVLEKNLTMDSPLPSHSHKPLKEKRVKNNGEVWRRKKTLLRWDASDCH
jgi:hypothetical protein